jgi:hypothetical protein
LAGILPQLHFCTLHFGEDQAGGSQDSFSGGRQRQSSTDPMEQRNTQLLFDYAELMAQSGLGEAQSLSSAGQAPLLHHTLDKV